MINYIVGMSLSPASSVESGVVVKDIHTNKIIYIDKLFSMNDVQLFFDNYSSIKNSLFCISLPWDNTMLEGKWRVHSKQYQLIHNDEELFLNKDNWMQRFSSRGCDLINSIKEKGAEIYRFEVYLTRQRLNLYSNYKERSSADCKFLQAALRLEHGYNELPANMMPVAQLEAIVGIILGEKKLAGKTSTIFNYRGIDVINVI